MVKLKEGAEIHAIYENLGGQARKTWGQGSALWRPLLLVARKWDSDKGSIIDDKVSQVRSFSFSFRFKTWKWFIGPETKVQTEQIYPNSFCIFIV